LTRRRAPPIFTPPPQFSSADYPPLHHARFIGSVVDYRLIPAGFRSTAADFGPPEPTSAPLSTGANGERRIHFVVELVRPNTIYMSSGPILHFFIQFEFYPTKQSRFEKKSPPMFLEFHLVFYIIFQIFFEISEFQFKKSTIFKIEPGRSRQNRPVFLTLHRTPFSLKEQLVINLTLVKLDIFFSFFANDSTILHGSWYKPQL
jgi:hypothetical protein